VEPVQRPKLELGSSINDFYFGMAEGNMGAMEVIMALRNQYSADIALVYLMRLNEWGCRGVQLWMAFKGYCEYDLQRFVSCIKSSDPDLEKFVNGACYCESYPYLMSTTTTPYP
jgi:hypothetical protein